MSEHKIRHACVLGFPVSHSLSPKLHNFWLKKYAVSGDYALRETPPDRLAETLEALVKQGYAGCNLTLPLKEKALPLMDEQDESCRLTGAVNTVVIRNGRKIGYNSDGFGFMESLREQHPGWDGRRVVILGAGGAARGIVAALSAAGAKHFSIANRTRDKAEKIIAAFGLKDAAAVDWDARHAVLERATLLVNCTSLGMTGQPPLALDISLLPAAAAVCDIVYRPLVTPLLAEAQRRGHPVVGGLPMLLHQGRLGFRAWFGVDPAVGHDLYEEMAAWTG